MITDFKLQNYLQNGDSHKQFTKKDTNKNKGGAKVQVLGHGGGCNSAPNEPNDLKFCIQEAFLGYKCWSSQGHVTPHAIFQVIWFIGG